MKFSNDYYLGFDIGTTSVGWCATDENYNILKFNKKSMWGVHLFEEAQTASSRRVFRASVRRNQRKKERLRLLRDLFLDEITKVDSTFFQRLQESKFFEDDKNTDSKYSLFADANFTDIDFYKSFPTIFHLKSELIHNQNPHDVRLVYLAIHNILKHRGHFLLEGSTFSDALSFEIVFNDFLNTLKDYDIDFGLIHENTDNISNTIKDSSKSKKDKESELHSLMQVDKKDKQKIAIIKLMCGATANLSDLYDDISLKDYDNNKISFSQEFDDEKIDSLEDTLEEKIYILNKIKAIYDWSILADILKENPYISDAKKISYNTHNEELKLLKNMVKKYLPKKEYHLIFKDNTTANNYPSYIGNTDNKKCSQEDFCSFIKKKFDKVDLQETSEKELLFKIDNNTAFAKQLNRYNSIIPYQIHLKELNKILENAKSYLPFLNNKDKDGISVLEKIISIFLFRVPYYVGPLNPHSKFAWIQKKGSGKIYPWNFDKLVDKEASASNFITRMTNKCSYLMQEDVLPKNSIIYSKFNILNQLNNLKVNGDYISIHLKQDIYNDLFVNITRAKKVSISVLQQYISSKTGEKKDDIKITGIDTEISGNIKTLLDFKKIFKENMPSEDIIDDIVSKIVILGKSKDLLKSTLQKNYPQWDKQQINNISNLNYSGWGRLSNKLLTGIYHTDKTTGECVNIISMLYQTNNNLQQLLSSSFDYKQNIDEQNLEYEQNLTAKEMISELYVSPAVKRSITRVIKLSQELIHITKKPPKKIFIEVAREHDTKNKGKKTTSRKEALQNLYKSCKLQNTELYNALQIEDEGKLRDNRLYLYYTQLGRCMYSNEKIDINSLFSKYDIDHIYPRSRVKDDSLNNKVLVLSTLNKIKSDSLIIPKNILNPEVKKHWNYLKDKGLISQEKYNRLNRTTPLSDDELGGFIARQLVETRQSTKALAHMLGKLYPSTDIVYVKAENVSDFRISDKGANKKDYPDKQEYNKIVNEYKFPKSRLINDIHHAKDAYLNIVVGNVYDEKFTKNPLNFIKSGETYSLNQLFNKSLIKSNKIIWDSTDNKSLKQVMRQVQKNNILYSRYAYTKKSGQSGGFFNQMLEKAGKGQFPQKTSDPRLSNIDRYGGYSNITGAYFFLVEHTVISKKQEIKERRICHVPVYLAKNIEQNPSLLQDYSINKLELVNPIIIIKKIKFDALFKVDGFKMHITGRTGDRLIFKSAHDLILNKELYAYSSKIEKYIEKNKKDNTVYPISQEHQKISSKQNLILYDELLYKLKNTLYNTKLSSQIEVFEKGRQIFIDLDVIKQCQFLYNALKLFGKSSSSKDLSLIGGSKNAGIILLSSNLKNTKSISIINQSVTGLFEQEIDLKTCGAQ